MKSNFMIRPKVVEPEQVSTGSKSEASEDKENTNTTNQPIEQ